MLRSKKTNENTQPKNPGTDIMNINELSWLIG